MSTENPPQPADQPADQDEPESTLERPPLEPADLEAAQNAGASDADDVVAAEVVDPALVRKAPRFRSFILVGVFSGLIAGFIVGLIAFWNSDNFGFKTMVLMVDLAIVTTVIALLWAILSDRRSARRAAATEQN